MALELKLIRKKDLNYIIKQLEKMNKIILVLRFNAHWMETILRELIFYILKRQEGTAQALLIIGMMIKISVEKNNITG